MTYDKLKPDAGPSPLLDAPIIQGNFSDFSTIFALNHIALNDRNQGAHGQVILENQAADPGVTEDLAVLYNKDAISNASTEPQLFVQIPKFLPTNLDTTDAPNTGMQLTYQQVNTAGPVYQSFLPGGYLFYTGTIAGVSVPNVITSLTVTLLPAPTRIITAIANSNTVTSPGGRPFKVSTTINTNDTFTIYSDANAGNAGIPYIFTWTAIAIQ